MTNKPADISIAVVIPAFNEENAIGKVLNDIPKEWVDGVVVVDNNSSDSTKEKAKEYGAIVLEEPFQGYGASCLCGINYLMDQDIVADIIVFLDADYSDFPEELPKIVEPILTQQMDMVIGSRALGNREPGSMTVPQIFGNWLATKLLRVFFGVSYTDLGPFRAITTKALNSLQMQDKTYGWTVEMQVKAAKMNLKTTEVPVNYKNRVGVSKISGTVKGTVLAGYKIIQTIFKYA
ncbi:glycosyltransferase family 2 protein [Salibacteraceae bacterium]|jgi:glycosyltransferase involved in cell wall biosynthesis|nr:UDP-glucose--dolichyl-phosphate glucosyltransferase [Crocinitomicaceae bacterium]MDB9724849.1 glycosyltransferase family 2 protein [Salibacteraceae bacterium]|tara:strand:- start:53471 stop:54175 length:705 start_codon:yes stop_codon:yes gene_type:complete